MMRVAIPALVLLTTLAGCLGDDASTDSGAEADSADEATAGTPQDGNGTGVPAPIMKDISIFGGFDAVDQAVAGGCQLQPWCFGYGFTADVPVRMEARLAWGLPATDFDLVVFTDGSEVDRATSRPPGTEEALTLELPAGAHEIVVVPYLVVDDNARLEVTFEAVGSSP